MGWAGALKELVKTLLYSTKHHFIDNFSDSTTIYRDSAVCIVGEGTTWNISMRF